nr:COMT protein [Stephania japonica]
MAEMGSRAEDRGKHEDLLEAQACIYKHTFSFVNSMSLKCAVELRIPDIIHNHKKPMTCSELVNALQIHESRSTHLYRLMRILVHNGFFALQKIHSDDHLRGEEQDDGEGYVLTTISKLLLKNHCLFPILFLGPELFRPWQSLSNWLKGGDGNSPFEAVHGKNLWEFGLEKLDVCNLFNEAMTADSSVVSSALVTKCKDIFMGLTSVVDVGGGFGIMARVIAETFPHIKCTVLDLPHVVASCKGTGNLEFVAGDMFQAIPSADALLLKWILHEMTDEDCLKILKRCRESILSKEKGGKVIIMDIVLDPNGGTPESVELQLFLDLQLMVDVNGKQRTESEWKKLFVESGFASYKINYVLGFRSVIEVFP